MVACRRYQKDRSNFAMLCNACFGFEEWRKPFKNGLLCGPYHGANDILMAISICNQWSVKWDLYASNAKNIAHLSMDLDLNGHIPGERRCTYGIGATPVQERKKQASEFFNQVSFLWKMLNIKVYGVSGDFIVRGRAVSVSTKVLAALIICKDSTPECVDKKNSSQNI